MAPFSDTFVVNDVLMCQDATDPTKSVAVQYDPTYGMSVDLRRIATGTFTTLICDGASYHRKVITATTAATVTATLATSYYATVVNESESYAVRLKLNGAATATGGIYIPASGSYTNPVPIAITTVGLYNIGTATATVSVEFVGLT